MTITTIIGNLTDSGTIALPSILRIKLDAPLHDTDSSPTRLLTTVASEIDVSGGTFTLALPESESANITYFFELLQREDTRTFFKPDGLEYLGGVFDDGNGGYFTGDPDAGGTALSFTDRTVDTVVMAFRCLVPPSTTPIAFGDLRPTGITREVLDANLARLAQILARDPDLSTQIVSLISNAANVTIAPTAPMVSSDVAASIAELLGLSVLKANNLADIASAVTARTNLGLGTAAIANSVDFAPTEHGHVVDEIAFATETAGGIKVNLTNAPNSITPFATPDEWVRIQIAGNTHVIPTWRL